MEHLSDQYVFLKLKAPSTEIPDGSAGKETAYQSRRLRTCWCDPRVGKISWRREWQPTPVLLLEESHGQWSLVGSESWIQLSD